MEHVISARNLSKILRKYFIIILITRINILFIVQVNILFFKLYDHINFPPSCPLRMFTTGPKTINKIQVCRPMTFEHMCLWCMFLDLHPNLGALINKILSEIGDRIKDVRLDTFDI